MKIRKGVNGFGGGKQEKDLHDEGEREKKRENRTKAGCCVLEGKGRREAGTKVRSRVCKTERTGCKGREGGGKSEWLVY